MFQRLLVAIDDTERSDITLSFATAVAKERGAVVHLFYVNEFAVGTGGMPLHTNEEAVALLTRAAEQLRAEGIRVTGSAVSGSLPTGPPAHRDGGGRVRRRRHRARFTPEESMHSVVLRAGAGAHGQAHVPPGDHGARTP